MNPYKGGQMLYDKRGLGPIVRGGPVWSYVIDFDFYVWRTKPLRTFVDPSATRDQAAAAIRANRSLR